MTLEKKNKFNWLNLVAVFWGIAGILCILPAGSVIVFFDAPSPNWSANYFFIFSVLSFPLVCILSGIGVWFLGRNLKKLALPVSLFPVFPLILIFAGGAWMNISSCGKFDCRVLPMQEQESDLQVANCTFPVVDGGDGIETTGCGVLAVGVIAAGSTDSLGEAHNWQFSTPDASQVTISIESGESCPQVRILDASGSIVEGFEDENQLHLCPSGMISTSFFYFNPPGAGTYILRLLTPKTPGAYWLKIQ